MKIVKYATDQTFVSVVAGALVLLSSAFGADAEPGKKPLDPTRSYDEADSQNCTEQLSLIYNALQEYQKQKHALPAWLSELVPDYLHDRNLLVCPFVRGTGNMRNWRKDLKSFQVYDEISPTSYGYELCTLPVRGLAGTNCREYKQEQMKVLGEAVPIVRCLAHEQALNLALDGTIYRSQLHWEDLFVKNTNDTRVLHSALPKGKSRDAVLELLSSRFPDLPQQCLDLSNYFNATLFHLSQVQFNGKIIESIGNGVEEIEGLDYEIRSLVHLTGKDFSIPFPVALKGINVERRCARVRVLHGAMGEASPGSKIATYVFHLENGEACTVPIIYGNDVKTRWFEADDPTEAKEPKPAWVSPPERVGPSGKSLRLYVKSWENPQPNVKVQSIDFISEMTTSAPFIVAITIE